jgi:hypothetical protein
MTKLFCYISLLTLLFFFRDNPCYANDDSLKVRKKILRIARKISQYKTVDFGPVGFSPVITRQYERFINLSAEATDTELALLTDHKSPKVRVYAFDILIGRKYKDIKSILEKHIADTAFFSTRSGCIRMKNRVNLHFLSRLTRGSKREKDYALSEEEIEYYKNKINRVMKQHEK